MKIIQIIRNFSSGGAERFTIDLANQLSLNGHDVTLVRFFDVENQNLLITEVKPGVKIVTIRKRSGFDPSLIWRLYRFLRTVKPDVVNTHLTGFTYTILSFVLLPKTKFFHTLHNMPEKEAMNRVDMASKKIFFKNGMVTPVSISDAVHESATVIYGNKVNLIYNGRSRPEKTAKYSAVLNFVHSLKTGNDCKIIANVANYRPAKNQAVLINAVKELNKQGHNVKLLSIGGRPEGEIYETLKERADANTLLIGTVNNVQDYLYAVDFFCLPSLWEGMPISLIEAFAAGCIPVCTPAGSIASMIENNVNGFLTDGFTEADIVETLKRVIQTDDVELERIGKQCIVDFSEKYSIEICAKNYLAIYSL